jgi:SAM-dependent methyltransferase
MNPSHTLNDPETTVGRAALLRGHEYLRRLYCHWYDIIIKELPSKGEAILELGSGGGFLSDLLPRVITSDILKIPDVNHVIDARSLPFPDSSLHAIVGTNVLHHIPEIERFFGEAKRTLVCGGRLIFVEPWPTALSRPIYRYFHHEPFDDATDWQIPEGAPLTSANGALPWIVFERDRSRFETDFAPLQVKTIRIMMPFSYLACGGIGAAWPLPGFCFNIARLLEKPLDSLGLFALTVVEKNS